MDSAGAPPNGATVRRGRPRGSRAHVEQGDGWEGVGGGGEGMGGGGWGGGEEGRRTFLVYPLHGEGLVVVHAAHVPHLAVQTLVGDGWLKVGDHDVPVMEGDGFD